MEWTVNDAEGNKDGSGGRTRTATGFTPTDFESVVSTNFTTPPSESVGDYTELYRESNKPAGRSARDFKYLQSIKQRQLRNLRK